MYENVVKECEICQKTKPAPPRSRFSGVRAKEFGDVVFMDHCEIKHMTKKHQLFLVLDGATSLLWGATQQEGTEPVTQDLFREWMHVHSCKPKWVVADMAFFTPSWMVFWKTHGVTHPTLNKVTLRDLIRECCWARNTTLTVSGYTPVELATGRRPTDHSDLELMKPDQLSVADLPRDATLNELRKLALKAHLEARQSADLRRDLARRVLPSDGPYAHGDRVFVWIDDKAKYKAVGRWARARVISQNGAIVTVETAKAVLRVNQSKVRRDYDPWHDVPLPRNLDKPEKDVNLQNMMRSVDALPARTEANLESVNGRSAEFFKTSVLYARRKLIPRLSFETSVIYRGTYGRKIPLSAMDDSCMILWWVKNKRPYQLFVTSSRDFMDVQRRMPASKISMVTFWSGRTSEVAQGGITMRDSATAGLGDQPPAPPRTLEQIPLQELYRPVPEEVLPPVTPPPVPAEQPIEVDDEDMQPPDQPQQSIQPPLTPPRGGLHVPLPDSPMQDSIPGSPGPPQDPPPPSPPPVITSVSGKALAPVIFRFSSYLEPNSGLEPRYFLCICGGIPVSVMAPCL